MKLGKILFLFLCIGLLLTSVVFPTVYAVEYPEPDYDYSRPGSYFNTTIAAADLIEHLGFTVSDAEREYLNAYCDFKIHYDRVTSQNIRVTVVDGATKVEAAPYTYTAKNGQSVTWVPVSATLDSGKEVSAVQSGDIYVADFGSVATSSDSTVNVKYRITAPFTVSADEINSFLNLTFNNVAEIKGKIDYYNSFYEANEQAILKYYADCELYEEYLDVKYIYDQKLGIYNEYLAAYKLYEDNLELYNKYLSDLDNYQNIKDTNEKNDEQYKIDKERYDTYVANLAIAEAQLKKLDDAFMKSATYLNRQLLPCMFADLVNEVVAQKDKLTTVFGDKMGNAIDSCAIASDNIRAILKPAGGKAYVDLKTTEEKYSFYVNNYEALRDNIYDLGNSLYTIYSAKKAGQEMPDVMNWASKVLGREDYTERLAIFISQLILLAEALDDSPEALIFNNGKGSQVKSSEIKFYYYDAAGNSYNKAPETIKQLLGDYCDFVVDTNNATPISLVPVPKPTEPTPIPLPDMPDEVKKPTQPIEVANPGNAPTVVEEPIAPTGMPTDSDWLEYRSNEIYQKLALAYSDITERTPVTSPLEYIPETTVSKQLSAEMVTVTFVDTNGNVLETVEVDKNTAATFSKTLPTKAEDISAAYFFSSWVTVDGEAYDLSAVSDNVILYPSFSPVYKEYGTLGRYLDVNIGEQTLTYLPLSHFMDLAKADRLDLRVTGKNAIVEINYSTLNDLKLAGVSYLTVSVDTSNPSAYTCKISARTEHGAAVSTISAVSVSIPCSDPVFGQDCILTEQGSSAPISRNYSAGRLKFSVSLNKQYNLTVKYSITLMSKLVGIVTAPIEAAPGETVTLNCNFPAGKTVELYYVLSDGSEYAITGTEFVMPSGNIQLNARVKDIEYVVTFLIDGKEYSKNFYKYGDKLIVPNAPTKTGDGTYTYKFKGWSPALSDTVTADAVYTAEFESTLIPVAEEKFSWFRFAFYTGITVFSLGIVTLVLFILNKKKVISIKGIFKAIGGLFKGKSEKKSDTVPTPEITDGSKENEQNSREE